jgi:hypothetical protein
MIYLRGHYLPLFGVIQLGTKDIKRLIGSQVMEQIRLETKAGDFVVIGSIPSFLTYPDIVTWGDRVFQLVPHGRAGELTVYRECFNVVVVSVEGTH